MHSAPQLRHEGNGTPQITFFGLSQQDPSRWRRSLMCILHSQESKNKKKLSNRELMEMAAEYKDRLEAKRSGSSSGDKEVEDASG